MMFFIENQIFTETLFYQNSKHFLIVSINFYAKLLYILELVIPSFEGFFIRH